VQGGEAARVASVDGGALLDEKLDDIPLARQGREDQWRLASIALRVDHRSFVDQHLNLLKITGARGVVERSSKRERTASKEHEQSHGNLNHFAPSHHLRLRHWTAFHKDFARLFPGRSRWLLKRIAAAFGEIGLTASSG
jgi:hypothetical protein